MSDTTYNDYDLTDLAAATHRAMVGRVDNGYIEDLMESETVGSLAAEDVDGAPTDADGPTWTELLDPEGDGTDAMGEAVTKVLSLVANSADLSEWAIWAGADKLTPIGATVDIAFDGEPGIRVFFALNSELIPSELHNMVVARLATALAEVAL